MEKIAVKLPQDLQKNGGNAPNPKINADILPSVRFDLVPKNVFFVKGLGRHTEQLRSFEEALRDAGIAPFNLVTVSSIIPPQCGIIQPSEGLPYLRPGEIVFCVLARNGTNEANRLVAASVGCALPADRNTYGYLSEHHSFGEPERKSGDYAEDLAASMLASTLGVEFNPSTAWDEKEEIFKISGKIVKTTNCTQTSIGKDDVWTTVIAVAVFLMQYHLDMKAMEKDIGQATAEASK
jgi:arginine decarboxylase